MGTEKFFFGRGGELNGCRDGGLGDGGGSGRDWGGDGGGLGRDWEGDGGGLGRGSTGGDDS